MYVGLGCEDGWIFWNFSDVGLLSLDSAVIVTSCPPCLPHDIFQQTVIANPLRIKTLVTMKEMWLTAVWRTDQSLVLIGHQVLSITSAWLDLNKLKEEPVRPGKKTTVNI